MKTLIISALTFLMSFTFLQAQTGEGTFSLGMFDLLDMSNVRKISKEFRNQNNSKNQSFDVTISPIASYFLFENLCIGLRPTYRYNIETSGGFSERDRFLGLSLFTRYYLGNGKFKPFVHAGYGLQRIYEKNIADFSPEKYEWHGNSYFLDMGIGVAYFITHKVSIDGLVFFSGSNTNMNFEVDGELEEYYKYKRKDRELSLKLSLLYYFGKQVEN